MRRSRRSKSAQQPENIVEGSVTHMSVQPYQKRIPRYIWPSLSLFSLLLFVGVWNVSIGSQATIHLVPVTVYRAHQIIVVATLHPENGQSQTRIINAHKEQIVSVSASGLQRLPATQANGDLTWYNATPSSQVIPPDTTIRTTTGQQIATNSALIVPAAQFSTPGQAEGPAHATKPGTQGNIAALTLHNNACTCLQGITVSNRQSFTGGRDDALMAVVRSQDIDGVATAQRDQIEQLTRKALHQQAAVGEQVVELSCALHASSDHPVGSLLVPGSLIRVTLTSSCVGLAYNLPAVQHLAIAAFAQLTHPVGAYQLRNTTSHIALVNKETGGKLTIGVDVRGNWVYQLTASARKTLRKSVAGSLKTQAQAFISHYPGIQGAVIECWWLWLPGDPAHITLLGV